MHSRTFLSLILLSALFLQATAAEPDETSQRGAEQLKAADLITVVNWPGDPFIIRWPEPKREFRTQPEFLSYLASLQKPKKLLVVELGKSAWFYTPAGREWINQLWEVCKGSGFEHVSIQGRFSFGQPILRE